MPKRKRSYEPSLSEKLTQWHKELARGMKTAKGFERQRLSKRIREAQAQGAADKAARLEREVAVLKSLDLQQAAHAHLCSSLLKIRGVAESPRLPSDLVKPVPKPDGLSEEEKAALHNVTSALCNRKQIRDVIEEAVMGTCMALRVLMPDKMKKSGGKDKKDKKEGKKEKEEQADESDDSSARAAGREEKEEGEGEQSESGEEEPEPVLLKRKRETAADEEQELSGDEENELEDEEPFEGFSGSDEEERVWSRYEAFVAGSSSDEDESDEDGEGKDEITADSKARSIRKTPTVDDMSISSADSSSEDEDENPDGSDSESSAAASPPPSKKSRSAKQAPVSAGGSAFLPSLMGGYISGSESEASDIDVGPPSRKNRRGQRARQAIWEKKYKEKAKHLQKQQDKGRDQGWDMRRGAVGDDDGSNKPWKKGIHNPFESKNVHPERLTQMQVGGGGRSGSGSGGRRAEERQPIEDKPRPKAPPKRDDTGPLHPSWAAAKKAKEQKVEFQGRKVVFD